MKKEFRYWEKEDNRTDTFYREEEPLSSIEEYFDKAIEVLVVGKNAEKIYSAAIKLFSKEDLVSLYIEAYIRLKSGFTYEYCLRHIKVSVRREISAYLMTEIKDVHEVSDPEPDFVLYEDLIFDGIQYSIATYLLLGYGRSDIYSFLDISKATYDSNILKMRERLIKEPEYFTFRKKVQAIIHALSPFIPKNQRDYRTFNAFN